VKLNVLISKTRIENVREELFGVKKDVWTWVLWVLWTVYSRTT
jgi:hypothetical protein